MEFDLPGKDAKYSYKLLAGLVVPRPIAWVTTLDENGTVNAAPFSFFNVMGTRPPVVAFAPGDRSPGIPKDTARNIRRSGEFVVNLVEEANAETMNLTSTEIPAGESEISLAGLHTEASSKVAPPRITEARVAIECHEWSTIEVGRNRIVLGLVQNLYVADGVLDPETLLVNTENYHPIGRMEVPDGYCRTNDRFDMKRP